MLENSIQKTENEIIVKSIVYGSIAFWLGKKADETVSHKWCVYVRGINNEDISYFVKKVVFTLHASFENHIRTVDKFPFELYESGWGQFDINITIYLIDESAKPIEFVHPLKLYPTQAHASMSAKKPVVSESYDEIIFVNPKPNIREILMNPPARKESNIQIPINIDEDRKSQDYSSEEKEEKSYMDKSSTQGIIPPFNRNMGQININHQKIEDLNIATNNKEFDNEMMVDSQMMPHDNLSMLSNSIMMDVDKNEPKKINCFIPNLPQYFLPIDDTPHYKILEDANKFVLQEINRLKKSLEDTDNDSHNIKKFIKEMATGTKI